MMTFKLCIFDGDGVVLNGPVFSQDLQKYYGVPVEQGTAFIMGPYQDCMVGKTDVKAALKAAIQQWNIVASPEELLQFWLERGNIYDEGLCDYISALRRTGYVCVLASNQEIYRAAYIRRAMNMGRFFDAMYVSPEIGAKKPSAAFFDRIVSDYPDIHKEQIICIDDSPSVIDAAQQFGMHGHLYTTLSTLKDCLAAQEDNKA
jgi:putative hydrolase of the HAD superfamily